VLPEIIYTNFTLTDDGLVRPKRVWTWKINIHEVQLERAVFHLYFYLH